MSASLIANAVAGFSGTTGHAEVTIDSRGADFIIVAAAAGSVGMRGGVITDGLGNTPTEIVGDAFGIFEFIGAGQTVRYWRIDGPVTSASHTIAVDASLSGHTAIGVLAFAGAADCVFNALSSNDGNTSFAVGAITIAAASLVVSFASFEYDDCHGTAVGTINSGFTLVDQLASQPFPGHMGMNSAYLVQTVPATINPTWSFDAGNPVYATVFAFVLADAAAAVIAPAPPADSGCAGGGAITIDADPADGPAFSGRLLEPRWWLTLGYDDQDRAFALDSGNHPPASEGRKIGNLIRGGTCRRGLSDRSTPYKMGEADVEVDDSSQLLAILEETAASQYWANRELRLRLSTRASIATSATPWTLFRGIWRGHTNDGLRRQVAMTSVLGSEFSDFNLERTIPDLQIKDVCPDAPKASLEKYLPIAYGIFPDPAYAGSADAVTGVVVSVASRPAAPTGFTATPTTDPAGDGDTGTTEYYAVTALVGGLESDPAYISATLSGGNNAVDLAWDAYGGATQINLYSAVRSDFLQFAQLVTPLAGGATSYRDIAVLPNQDRDPLAATGVWSLGERMTVRWDVYAQLSNGRFTAPGRSADLVFTPISNSFRRRDMTASCDPYTPPVGTTVVKYFFLRHVELYSGWNPRYDLQLTCIPPTVTVTDTNNDDALITGGFGDGPTVTVNDRWNGCVVAIPAGKETIGGVQYNRLLLSDGAWKHVEAIWVSKPPTTPDGDVTYDRVEDGAYGSTWLAPGKSGWPYGTNYVAYNGVWCQPVFTTLDPLPDTILVDGCALTDVSDGSGDTIDGAGRILFHLLQQRILPPFDEAWRSGTYLTPRTFADGTPVINTASLGVLETIETERIGQYYRGQVYIDQPITLRELLARVFVSWGIRVGENEHGQVVGKHLDDFTDLSAVPHLTDRADIIGSITIDRRVQELENAITYDYGYRPAKTGSFLLLNQVQKSDVAIGTKSPPTGNRGVVARGEHRQMSFVDDPVTAQDVIAHDLAFGQYVPRYLTIPITLEAFLHNWGTDAVPQFLKLGDVFLVTDAEQRLSAHPVWLLDVEVTLNDLETAPEIALIAVDVKRLLDSYGVWATDSTPNFASASDAEQASLVFWTNPDGTMSDGSTGKVWN